MILYSSNSYSQGNIDKLRQSGSRGLFQGLSFRPQERQKKSFNKRLTIEPLKNRRALPPLEEEIYYASSSDQSEAAFAQSFSTDRPDRGWRDCSRRTPACLPQSGLSRGWHLRPEI